MYTYEWLPHALNIGISEQQFWRMNPRLMKPYRIAYGLREEKKQKEIDYIGWLLGFYNSIAFEVPLARFGASLSKKKTDVKYLDKPISMKEDDSIVKKDGEMSEEEIKKAVEKLFGALDTIALNDKLEKMNGSGK